MDAEAIQRLIDLEIDRIEDEKVVQRIRQQLVRPTPRFIDWDYGPERYICWDVFVDKPSGTGIAYSEFGFGPCRPWGLVEIIGASDRKSSMGPDSSWFATFLDAYLDCWASEPLQIWRVHRIDSSGRAEVVSGKMTCSDAIEMAERLKCSDPRNEYQFRDCLRK